MRCEYLANEGILAILIFSRPRGICGNWAVGTVLRYPGLASGLGKVNAYVSKVLNSNETIM